MSKTDKAVKTLVITMALGTFVVVLDNTIMNVSISALVEDLNTTVSGVQAAIALNALMMAAFVLMGGKMADILGMKKTFLMGAIIYVAGSLLASFSHNLAIFILGWCAIQGFGAAMMLPNVSTIIKANITGPARGQAFGAMAGINALAMAVGPLIGGFLTTFFSWRWAFRLEVFILLGVLLMANVIPKDVMGKVRPSLDKVGVALQAAAMLFIVLGTLGVSDYGLLIAKQPLMIGDYAFAPFGLSIVPFLLGLGAICLILFVQWEKKVVTQGRDVLVDLSLFKIIDFIKSLNLHFIQVGLVAGTTFAIPLFLQVTYGLSAFQTGFILVGFSAGLIITAIGASKKAMHILPKKKVEWGFLVAIIGLAMMMVYMRIGDAAIGLVPGIFVFGLGLGLVTSQIVNLIMSAVSAKQSAEASGVNSTLETLGSSMGTALVGAVMVIALTSGIGKMVQGSEVFSPEAKAQIESELAASVEIVSTEVVSETIQENGEYEAEAIRIYDQARENAFIITMLFMAFVAFVSFLLAKNLPGVKSSELAGEN